MKRHFKILALALAVCIAAAFGLTACKKNNKVPEKVTVSFDLNYAGAPTPPADRDVTPGEKYGSLPSVVTNANSLKRTGYTFAGWYFDKSGEKGPVTGESKVEETADHTLYAKWTEILKIKVTFDMTDVALVDGVYNQGTVDASGVWKTVEAGGNHGALPNVESTVDGSTFAYWYTLTEGVETKIENSTPVTINTAHTVYPMLIEQSYLDFAAHPEYADIYFERLNGLAWGEDAQDLAIPVTYESGSVKFDNSAGDSGVWIAFGYTNIHIPANYKITFYISAQFAAGAMTGNVRFVLNQKDVVGGTQIGAAQIVAPVGNAWPSANGGIQEITFNMVEGQAHGVSLMVDASAISQTNRNNSVYRVHAVKMEPMPAVDTSYMDFAANPGLADLYFPYLHAMGWGDEANSLAIPIEYDNGSVKIDNYSGDSGVWVEFGYNNMDIPANYRITFYVSAEFAPNAMTNSLVFIITPRNVSGGTQIGPQMVVAPVGNAWPTDNGGIREITFDLPNSLQHGVSLRFSTSTPKANRENSVYRIHAVRLVPIP